jgi:endonuclease/exonuclease/phosphatase family metal-dependent hydrolase
VKRIPLPGVEPRVLLLAEFADCWIGSTHLDLSRQKRLESVPLLRDALAAADKPVFLCGDWNATPDSDELKGIGGFARVISATEVFTFHGLKKDGSKSADYGKCIDYVAVDAAHARSVKVLSARTVDDRLSSDHAPITVTVDLK